MKLLLSAYACEPGEGSEEGVGWNTVIAASQRHEVWVLTRTFYRPYVEAELARNLIANLHFVYFEPLGWSQNWKGKQGVVQLHYYLWQVWAYRVGRSLNLTHRFDLVHHVTYCKYWSPSFLSLLPLPFLWGPVGGGESAPKSFWKDFSFRGKIYELLRDTAQSLGARDPFTQITAQRSKLALVTSEDTLNRVQRLKAKNVRSVSSITLTTEEIDFFAACHLPNDHSTVRFVSIGRFLHWKGFHLGIKAFADAQLKNSEYWLAGDGPERQRLENLVVALGIADQVKFLGQVPRQDLVSKLTACHILVHPSLHESGGFVCSEMMAAGRPVICLDLGGPALQVTAETGIKVPAINPEQTICDLAEAMICLAKDPSLRQEMGQAGQKRVKESFNWDTKAQLFNQFYEEIAAQKT